MSVGLIVANVVSFIVLVIWLVGGVRGCILSAKEAKQKKAVLSDEVQSIETADDNR